jgi:hypothetical protein
MASDPGTNQPAPKKSNTTRWILFGCGGLFIVFLLCASPLILWGGSLYRKASEETKREKAVESEAGTPVTAIDLTTEYDDDSKTADSKYKNKVLVVSGKVVTIVGMDRTSEGIPPTLSLEGFWPPGGRLKTSVHCAMSDKNKSQLANVQPGDDVKVKGYFSGENVPIIKLEQCQIEK